MIYLVWIISLIAIFFLGFYARNIRIRIEVLEQEVKAKANKPAEPAESSSQFIDPMDEVQTAIYEAEQMRKKLNEQK